MTRMTEIHNCDLEKRLVSQLDSIRIEMASVIKAISDRQDNMELEQKNMLEQLGELQKQMDDMKKGSEALTTADLEPGFSLLRQVRKLSFM